ncbi:MAG: DUF3375 family protein [Pseudomonadota bacterium]|nr:DUF3375 family protein [Pseudomonadota bacterium]
MDARARSESGVRSFMQTGLAAEHHRVGPLVQQVLRAALAIDWQPQATRRTPADVPAQVLADHPGGLHWPGMARGCEGWCNSRKTGREGRERKTPL